MKRLPNATDAKRKIPGLTAYESSCWLIVFRDDAHEISTRPAPSPVSTPIQGLCVAMLEQASEEMRLTVVDLAKKGRDEAPNPESARAWVKRTDDDPLGFVWCCQALNLDPDAMRQGMLRRPRVTGGTRSPWARPTPSPSLRGEEKANVDA